MPREKSLFDIDIGSTCVSHHLGEERRAGGVSQSLNTVGRSVQRSVKSLAEECVKFYGEVSKVLRKSV